MKLEKDLQEYILNNKPEYFPIYENLLEKNIQGLLKMMNGRKPTLYQNSLNNLTVLPMNDPMVKKDKIHVFEKISKEIEQIVRYQPIPVNAPESETVKILSSILSVMIGLQNDIDV